METRLTRERLEAMTPTDTDAEAERAVFLAMLTTLEREFLHALGAVVGRLKGPSRSAEAEAWFRRLSDMR